MMWIGVDAHKSTHVALALDAAGQPLGECPVPNTLAGRYGSSGLGAAVRGEATHVAPPRLCRTGRRLPEPPRPLRELAAVTRR
jgi:hypothetical protein